MDELYQSLVRLSPKEQVPFRCIGCGEYNDGYDGYYEDLLPVDHGKERFETDSAPIKKIIVLAIGVLVVIGLCVLMLYFV